VIYELAGASVARAGKISDRTRRAAMKFFVWFLAGVCLVLTFQAFFISRHAWDWRVLVRVGATKPHRGVIESELGPMTCLDAPGHDGQVNYLVARDPFNRHGTDLILSQTDRPPYRFRRILYPLLAGGFGLLGPHATVCGLLFWMAFGGGLIVASVAVLCSEWQLPRIVIPLALLNPGIYLSAQVLTNDVLAMGLALSGVLLWSRRLERTAAVVLAVAVLVRETSILVSLALALADLRSRGVRASLTLVFISALPFVCWSLWVRITVPGGNGEDNLGLPFVGIYRSLSLWNDPPRVAFGFVTLVLLAVGALIAWKTDEPFLRLSCVLWIAMAVVLSEAVWEHPGNLIRAISPLWVFAALGYGTWKKKFTRPIPATRCVPSAFPAGASPLQEFRRETVEDLLS
jgi:hypothetical protein